MPETKCAKWKCCHGPETGKQFFWILSEQPCYASTFWEDGAYAKSPLILACDTKKKKSKALFFDKVWGPKIEKSTRYWGGWINTIEIVFIRLIRKVHSLKTIMADIIMTAFNFLQRHVLSAHRYLAVCGALHKVRQTWSLFTEVLTIVRRLCWEHNFLLAAVVWKTLLVIICAVWVFDFWGVFSFSFLSFNYTVQSGILSSGDIAGWLQVGGGEYSYRVGGVSLQNVLCPLYPFWQRCRCFVPLWSLSLPILPSSSHCAAVTSPEVTVDWLISTSFETDPEDQ